MDEQIVDRQRHTFQRWYQKNGGQLNAKRRQRYADDPEYRERAKAVSRVARTRRKERGGVSETTVMRIINGVEVELYRVSAAAEMIGKSPDTIRLWCRKGWIPDGETGEHRLYRLHQIKLLKTLALMLEQHRYAKNYQKVLKACVAHIHKKW